MLKEDLSKYLKYGHTWDFDYGQPIKQIDITWEDAKLKLYSLIRESILELNLQSVCFCGTLGGYALNKILNRRMISWSVDLGFDLEPICFDLNLENKYAKIDNVEESLIELNKLWDSPRCELEDIFAYSRQKEISKSMQNTKTLCEGGSDWVLMGENRRWFPVMLMAINRGEYSFDKAFSYGGKGLLKIKRYLLKGQQTYFDCFTDYSNIFSDDELYMFGLNVPKPQLRDDTIEDISRLSYDWGYMRWKTKTDVLASLFGFSAHPVFLLNEKLVNFCLSLPLEMKYCISNGRHILKEIIDIETELIRGIYGGIQNQVESSMDSLINKYIINKNRIIHDFLPYDKTIRMTNQFLKIWQLLNLSIWMEVHK